MIKHHTVNAFSCTAVGAVGAVGKPGIESGIVGSGAKEGHKTVKDYCKAYTKCCGRSYHREHCAQHIGADKCKAEYGYAPQNIACADKHLAFANLVRQSTHKHGGQCCGNGRSRNHKRYVGGGSGKHLVDKYVKVHIFHNPCHLTGKAAQHKCQPEFGGKFCFHINAPLWRKLVYLKYTTIFVFC